MQAFHGIPEEGTFKGEYAPKPVGRKLASVSVMVGVGGLLAIPVLWITQGSPLPAWTFAVLVAGLFAFMSTITLAIHFAGRGMRVELDFGAQRLVITRRRRSGATTERAVAFADILRVELQSDGQMLRVFFRKGFVIIRDSLSNFTMIKLVLMEIAEQTDALPMYRTTWFQMTIAIGVMWGLMGALLAAFLMGWI